MLNVSDTWHCSVDSYFVAFKNLFLNFFYNKYRIGMYDDKFTKKILFSQESRSKE